GCCSSRPTSSSGRRASARRSTTSPRSGCASPAAGSSSTARRRPATPASSSSATGRARPRSAPTVPVARLRAACSARSARRRAAARTLAGRPRVHPPDRRRQDRDGRWRPKGSSRRSARAYRAGVSTEHPAERSPAPPGPSDVPGLPSQRRTLTTLAATQVLSGVGVASGIAVAPLVASALSGSDAIAGLTSTAGVVGAALVALPLADVAGRRGRRPSLLLGFGVAAGGAVLATVAVLVGSWPLLVVAMLLFGSGAAAGLASRFAATDLATPERRARDLSVVVWATTVGSVVGPTLAGAADRVAGPVLRLGEDAHAGHGASGPSAAPFVLASVAFVLAAAVVAVWLRPDPLLASRAATAVPDRGTATATPDRTATAPDRGTATAGPGGAPAPAASWRAGLSAGWAVVTASPTARLALGAIVLSHLVMVGLMSMTPVHMNHGGATLQVVGLVISAHIAGMYALSPVVGWLADRVG